MATGFKKNGKFVPTEKTNDQKRFHQIKAQEALKKYQQGMKQLAGKDGMIDLNNPDKYNEYGKIRDEYNEQKWKRQGLSEKEIYQKWEESQG